MHPRKQPNSDRSRDSLEARLRGLPPPPVPGDLEAMLLTAIPPEMPCLARTSRSLRRAVWVGAAVGLAAACLVAVLLWREPDSKLPGPPLVEKKESVQPFPALQPGDSPGITSWLEVRRGLDVAEKPPFTWPIEEESRLMVSIAIAPDLFD